MYLEMLTEQVMSANDARSSATARLHVSDAEISNLNVSTRRIVVITSKIQSASLCLLFVRLLLILAQRIQADAWPNLEPSTASRHFVFEPQCAPKPHRYKLATSRQCVRACAVYAATIRLLCYDQWRTPLPSEA